MFRRNRHRYLVLQDYVPLHEQRAIEQAVAAVVRPVEPPPTFVAQLEQDLIEEATRICEKQSRAPQRALWILGILTGGLLPLIGGLLVWIFTNRGSRRAPAVTSPASAVAGSA